VSSANRKAATLSVVPRRSAYAGASAHRDMRLLKTGRHADSAQIEKRETHTQVSTGGFP
jgi:hypothetical protein